jgi:hypothetical protein
MQPVLVEELFGIAKLPDLTKLAKGKEFGTLTKVKKQLDTADDKIGAEIKKFKAEFALAVQASDSARRAENLSVLVHLLQAKPELGGTIAERCLRVVRWCRMFGPTALLDSSQNRKIDDLGLLAEMIDEIHDRGEFISKGFRHYCTNVPGAAENVYLMRKKLGHSGKPKAVVYSVIHFLHQNGLTYNNLTPENITNVFDMALKAPPFVRFAGLDRWGSGNHSSPDENMKMHFYKHCLDAHPNDKEKLPWHEECNIWWEKLGIVLKEDVAKAKIAAPLFMKLKPMFKSGELPAGRAGEAAKAARDAGGWGAAILTDLHAAFGKAYADLAIAMSKDMKHVMVHGDVKKNYAVMVKGIHDRFFIGSRIDAGDISISTCFVPKKGVDLAKVNEEKKLWDIKQD